MVAADLDMHQLILSSHNQKSVCIFVMPLCLHARNDLTGFGPNLNKVLTVSCLIGSNFFI